MKSNTSTPQKKRTMKTKHLLIALVLLGALLLVSCAPRARVGALRTESQSVELGNARSVRVDITFGAGDLEVSGGAEKLLEADFTYNVARLKPEVTYTNGTLAVRSPEIKGLPALQGITDFRNEWGLRLYDAVPMDLHVDMGGGTSNLQLAGLSLTRLDIDLGAGVSTVDLSGDWAHDLDVTIDSGAADLLVLLPSDVGVRVEVETALGSIDAPDLIKDGNIYTNAAYAESEATLQVIVEAGVGLIDLEVVEVAAASD